MAEGEEAQLLKRERRLAAVGSLLEFAEDWKEDELCGKFRVISGSLFPETPEFRLACILVEASEPLRLSEIAARCRMSRDLVLREGRVRRAIERMRGQACCWMWGGRAGRDTSLTKATRPCSCWEGSIRVMPGSASPLQDSPKGERTAPPDEAKNRKRFHGEDVPFRDVEERQRARLRHWPGVDPGPRDTGLV
jgi:hypothetical protein